MKRAAAWTLAALLAAAGLELARNPGLERAFLWVGLVAAPVLVILGASLAGVRRWWGWPDLGPTPGKVALFSCALMAGVLVGGRVKEGDVAATRARGKGLAADLRAWSAAHAGAWPESVGGAVADAPNTRLGFFPPAFRWLRDGPALAFDVGNGRVERLRVDRVDATWEPGS